MSTSQRRVIVSTIGTSLLSNSTNQAQRPRLSQLAHAQVIAAQDQEFIDTLVDDARKKLLNPDPSIVQRASAELNGILSYYRDKGITDLKHAKSDTHILITTSTAQGMICAGLVEEYLRSQGIADVQNSTPKELITSTADDFGQGIKELARTLTETLQGYRESQRYIVFNVVGAFKSLQAFMSTVGMLYADEVFTLFEGMGSPLITIPRLPIHIDIAAIKQYAIPLALMTDGKSMVGKNDVVGLAPTLYEVADDMVDISTWGQLIWGQVRDDLYTTSLLKFPRLEYLPSFIRDFEKCTKENKISLQQKLARVAALLQEAKGDRGVLRRDGGLQYEDYENSATNNQPIGHFRITLELRVSCQATAQGLQLRHFGSHDFVTNNP